MQNLHDIIEQSVAVWCITSLSQIPTRAATIHEQHVISGCAQTPAGEFVPAAVALNAVQCDDVSLRR
jgi:hypothetical protein